MTKSFFHGVWEDLMEKLEDEQNEVYQGIVSGVKLKDRMLNCSNFVKNGFGNMKIDPKKREFRAELKKEDSEHYMMDFGVEGISSPLNPKQQIFGVDPDKCSIMASFIQPIVFGFKGREKKESESGQPEEGEL